MESLRRVAGEVSPDDIAVLEAERAELLTRVEGVDAVAPGQIALYEDLGVLRSLPLDDADSAAVSDALAALVERLAGDCGEEDG